MFGDLKGHGVDIESTHLRHFLRLSRLTLAVVLLYFWLIAFGAQTIKSGQRRLVDRNDRRDYSIFRIGFASHLSRCTRQCANASTPAGRTQSRMYWAGGPDVGEHSRKTSCEQLVSAGVF